MTTPLRHCRSRVLTVALTLVAVACGQADGTPDSDSSSSETGTTAPTTTSPPTTTDGMTMTTDTPSTSADTSTNTSMTTTTSDDASSEDESSTGDPSESDTSSESTTAETPSCGDGARDEGELCDDGDDDDTNLCRGDCDEIVLDFDTDAEAMPIADATVLDGFYADLGLVFARGGNGMNCISGSGGVFANADHYPDDWGTSPNTVTTCEPGSASDIAEEFQGAVRVEFPALPAGEACVLVWAAGEDSRGFVRAFDDQDMLLDEALSDAGVTGELCLASPGMTAVEIGGLGQTYVRLDDFRLLAE